MLSSEEQETEMFRESYRAVIPVASSRSKGSQIILRPGSRQSQMRVASRQSKNSFKISMNVSDDEFKASYTPNTLRKQSTLVLRTSFHLINFILMGLCQTFDNIRSDLEEQKTN